MLAGLWRGVELIALAIVSIVSAAVYEPSAREFLSLYAIVAIGAATAGVAAIQTLGGYEFAMLRRPLQQVPRVAGGWAIVLAAIAVGFVATDGQEGISYRWIAAWYVAGVCALCTLRVGFGARIRQWTEDGRLERRAVLVGGGPHVEALIRRLRARSDGDVRVCGIFDDRDGGRSPVSVAGCRRLGDFRELVEFTRHARIDVLIVTLPPTAEKRLLQLLQQLWILPIDIRLSLHRSGSDGGSQPMSENGDVPLIDIFDKPISEWDAIAKRVFDIGFASVALLLALPLCVATAIAIKLESKGPVLFRQKRHGFNNQIIEVLKFRSMYHEMADPTARRVVTKGDPRVTRVGRFIRKSSIDELPQLWNVLRGDLSLVGPRPHAVNALSSNNEAFIELVDGYFGRHRVKPGITGWAQINGYRGEIDQAEKLRKRFEFDLAYIENWSIFLDLAILAKTPLSLVKTENAY